MKTNTFFPIRVLEQKSGVKSSTIRAWERRYGLITPKRTPKGHRLYSQHDLQRINRIKELLEDGHSFTNIKNILENHEELVDHSIKVDFWLASIDKFKSAVSDFSFNRIDTLYNEIASLYPIELVSEKLLQPLLKFYSKEALEVSESSFFNQWLKIRLTSRFYYDNTKNNPARKIIFSSDLKHETSLMLLSNMVVSQGYQALFFGSSLPYMDIKYVFEKSSASALFIIPSSEQINSELFINYLSNLKKPIFIFGDFNNLDLSKVDLIDNFYYLGDSKPIAINVFRKHMHNIFHE